MVHLPDQPVAGPSSRPYRTPSYPPTPLPTQLRFCSQRDLDDQCPYLLDSRPSPTSPSDELTFQSRTVSFDAGGMRQKKRNDPSNSTSLSMSSSSQNFTSSSSALFNGPSSITNSSAYPSSSATIDYTSYTDSQSPDASSTSTSFTHTFSKQWTHTVITTSPGTANAAQTSYVPGVILDLTLAGDSDFEAVYSIPIVFGHGPPGGSDAVFPLSRSNPERRDASDSVMQTVNLQVDLGSSDLWVASGACITSDCSSASFLFNGTQSLDAGVMASMSYQSGSISGGIYWEQMELGDLTIGYQAFVLADSVSNEDLSGGNYTGVLGLALPENSIILSKIPGTTGSNPDGATFLDNLFGSGTSAPTQKLFSLALGRREDVRTTSFLSIGTVSPSLCPSPCSPPYFPIIAQPSLGAIGFLHWRIPLEAITATTWTNPQHGVGASTTNITLGASLVDPVQSLPLAVLDSGGVPILVGYKPYVDAIYTAYGISASSDGFYRLPCTQQLALTFTFGGQQYPINPLDMTWPDPADPSQAICIGAVQYSSSLGDTGDFILGSSFLKNVYSIFQYPSVNETDEDTWQPTVGLVSLTNASMASTDFYAVRSLHQSLSSVSAAQRSTSPSSNPSAPSPSTSSAAGNASAPHKILSAAGIATISTVGFFVLAASAFCAWWFWLRRKSGSSGTVDYPPAPALRGMSHKADLSTSLLRSKKHDTMQRQKSMMEGYADYEGGSWLSTTEGGDSVRLHCLSEVLKEDGTSRNRAIDRSSLLRDSSVGGEEEKDVQLVDFSDAESAKASDASSALTRSVSFAPSTPGGSEIHMARPSTAAYPYPRSKQSSSARSLSLSMSGPFPSSSRQSLVRPDASPMYDVRPTDYFGEVSGSALTTTGRGQDSRRLSSEPREASESRGRRSSPQLPGTMIGTIMVEEPTSITPTEEKEERLSAG